MRPQGTSKHPGRVENLRLAIAESTFPSSVRAALGAPDRPVLGPTSGISRGTSSRRRGRPKMTLS